MSPSKYIILSSLFKISGIRNLYIAVGVAGIPSILKSEKSSSLFISIIFISKVSVFNSINFFLL